MPSLPTNVGPQNAPPICKEIKQNIRSEKKGCCLFMGIREYNTRPQELK